MLTWLEAVSTFIHEAIGLNEGTFRRILWTILVVLVYVVISSVAKRLMARYLDNPARRYVAGKTVATLLGLLSLVLVARIWLGGVSGIMTYLGLVSAGVAIALKDPLTNVAAWLFIIARRPFRVGDRVQIGPTAGDVIDIRLFQFTLIEIGNWVGGDQSTGRIIHIPNGLVFTEPTANYTQGFAFIWNEIEVVVTFESDWKKAKGILQAIADRDCAYDSQRAEREVKQAADRYLIHYRHFTPIVWTSVVDHGVRLTIRHLCEPRGRRSLAMRIWEDILTDFAAHDDIDFAYPTQRLFFNQTEGKPGAAPPR